MASGARWLIRLRQAPYLTPRLKAGIDAALACGAFGQSVDVIVEGAACALLNAALMPPDGEPHLGKNLAALPLYDIEQIYVRCDAMASTSPPELSATLGDEDGPRLVTLDDQGFADLVAASTHVLSF